MQLFFQPVEGTVHPWAVALKPGGASKYNGLEGTVWFDDLKTDVDPLWKLSVSESQPINS